MLVVGEVEQMALRQGALSAVPALIVVGVTEPLIPAHKRARVHVNRFAGLWGGEGGTEFGSGSVVVACTPTEPRVVAIACVGEVSVQRRAEVAHSAVPPEARRPAS